MIAGRTVYMGLKSCVNLIWLSGIPLHCDQDFADYDDPGYPPVWREMKRKGEIRSSAADLSRNGNSFTDKNLPVRKLPASATSQDCIAHRCRTSTQ